MIFMKLVSGWLSQGEEGGQGGHLLQGLREEVSRQINIRTMSNSILGIFY